MKKQNITTYEEAVAYIFDTPKFTKKNSPEDTKRFLRELGNPDKELNIIHVAGTNGKGSVCAYMRSILEAAGKRVAVFTSPHLVDVRERFVIDGEMIAKEDFLRGFLTVYNRLDWEALETGENAYHPTFFEFMFFIAMLVFAGKQTDYCILETGLGGRLDATNSVEHKLLSVITHISLDHVEYLGDTVEKIAREKAGIIKAGVPVVYWDTQASVSAVFEKQAEELGSAAQAVSKQDYRFLRFRNKSIDFSVSTRYYGYIELTIGTIATYQMENAALAVRAIETVDGGRSVTAKHIFQGVKNCFWAGRMEEVLPQVFVDGAHNEDGVRAFLETVSADGHEGPRALLFSVVSDKDYTSMVKQLMESHLFTRAVIAHMHTGRAASLELLQSLFGQYPECSVTYFDNVPAAFRELLHSRMTDERVYIAGSLYLAGEIKELLKNDQF